MDFCTVVSPDLTVAVDRGNVVLVTPERTITVTDVMYLASLILAARAYRDAQESGILDVALPEPAKPLRLVNVERTQPPGTFSAIACDDAAEADDGYLTVRLDGHVIERIPLTDIRSWTWG